MSFSRPLPHAEYLRLKYSGKPESDQKEYKHRKKRQKALSQNIKIVDDDIDLKEIKIEEENDGDMSYATKEEKPAIAGVVDERPKHMIRKDLDQNRWRTLEPIDVKEEPETPLRNDTMKNQKSRSRCNLSQERQNSEDLSPLRCTPERDNEKRCDRHDSDSDLSPPRPQNTQLETNRKSQLSRRRSCDSDDDLSPPRQESRRSNSHSAHDKSPSRYPHKQRIKSPSLDQETKDQSELSKTCSGKTAGLSDSKSVREEMKHLRERVRAMMERVGQDKLGKNAKTVYRDRSTGHIRDLGAEAAVKVKPDKEEEERNTRYKEWSQGLKQREERKERLEQDLKEMEKPLARYEDDEDRDKMLKEKELEEDPMLQFVRRKKLKAKVREASDRGEVLLCKPVYKGPPPPPNRFNILPGYRWDGVDRSNGFEKKLADKQAEKIAVQEEAYKWSTEDM